MDFQKDKDLEGLQPNGEIMALTNDEPHQATYRIFEQFCQAFKCFVRIFVDTSRIQAKVKIRLTIW